jgi:hypothetical protein
VLRLSERTKLISRRELALAITLLSFGQYCLPFLRAQQKPNEYQVKAAYLFNFGKFVTSLASNGDAGRFTICVLGKDPFGVLLDSALANQTIGGQGVVARRLTKPEDAVGCRILFISSSEDHQLRDILMALAKNDVLTVSDIAQFSERGGMIEFIPQGDRVRFAVNVSNVEDAGLSLSSELLKVAVAVKRNAHRPGEGD